MEASPMSVWLQSDRLKTLAFLMAGAGSGMTVQATKIDHSIYGSLGLYIGGMILPLAAVVLALEIGRRDQKHRP